jgi:hypothetical protein
MVGISAERRSDPRWNPEDTRIPIDEPLDQLPGSWNLAFESERRPPTASDPELELEVHLKTRVRRAMVTE